MRTRRALITAAVLTVAGCSSSHPTAAPTPTPAATTSAATFTLSGTLTLGIGAFWNNNGSCTGNTGYSDIAPGTQVVVADQNGQTIGVGKLADGTTQGDGAAQTCQFIFGATVPDGATFYAVTVSHRGTQTFSNQQAKAGIALTLG